MSLPRLLTIMGSGETAPTMVKVHRELIERVGPPPVLAVMLDTPFGFQENADEISERAKTYFAKSVGSPLDVARLRSAEDFEDPLARERAMSRIRDARYVFAGPGSPTYVLSQWASSQVPGLLAEKLTRGGAVTFASAAALTLGLLTVPVYEIYKVGAAPYWAKGLDLLSLAGLRAVVIPHYNNAEGGTHDTRFCYLGERRLSAMEEEIPDDAFVLGVDEHTALLLDLDTGRARVLGNGRVTVRRAGRSREVPAGAELAIAELAVLAAEHPSPSPSTTIDGLVAAPEGSTRWPGRSSGSPLATSPLLDTVQSRQDEFAAALERSDMDAAVRTILELDDELQAWKADTLQSDEMDRARAALRGMVVRLGELAAQGARDPRKAIGPFVDLALEVRSRARSAKRWEEADQVREALVAAGVAIQDTADGTTWEISGP
jgi:hypothetical protein